jgi:hypothetical protein
VTQFKAKVVMNLVTPEAAVGVASEAGLLNKGSCLARDLGATNFFKTRDMILVILCCATQVPLICSTNPPGFWFHFALNGPPFFSSKEK